MPKVVHNLNQLSEIAKVLAYCPNERKLFDIFEGLYLNLRDISEEVAQKYQLQHLMLRCIHYSDAESYNNIADYYIQTINSKFLGFLSDLASLRKKPDDERVYKRAAAFAANQPKVKDVINEKAFMLGKTCDVSIIIPTYNRDDIIKESIASVLKQEHKDFELIVVNDGGDDQVESTIEQFADSRIRYVKISHSGLAGALNAGLQKARGEYIAYLDDDDIYYPDHLSTLLSVAKQKGKDFVYAKSKIVHGYRDDLEKFRPVREAGTHSLPYSKSNLANHLGISVINVLHKRYLAWQAGLFNAEIPWSMDWDLWMRMSDICEPYFVDKWTAEYRRTPDNMTTSNCYQGVFYMHHLLSPYFTTGYGVLTLYQAAFLLGNNEKELWSEKLSSHYISQDEIIRSVIATKRLLLDASFLYKTLLANKYRREYSKKRMMIQLLRLILSNLLKVYKRD